MISKNAFVKIINKLDELNEAEQKLSEAFSILGNDNSFFLTSHENIIVELLKDIFNDDELIEFYLYEIDYGNIYYDTCVLDRDGENILLETPEQLYDLLICEMENQKSHLDNIKYCEDKEKIELLTEIFFSGLYKVQI